MQYQVGLIKIIKAFFSMSTGSGKSYTALACMVDLARKLEEKLAVFYSLSLHSFSRTVGGR